MSKVKTKPVYVRIGANTLSGPLFQRDVSTHHDQTVWLAITREKFFELVKAGARVHPTTLFTP